MKKVLVCGGRYFRDVELVNRVLDQIHGGDPITAIIEGDADGADRIAKCWALARDIPVYGCPADWDDLKQPGAVIRYRQDGKPYNANAGFARNQMMLDTHKPRVVVGFAGGRGTADMLARARRAGIRTLEVLRGGEQITS